VTKQEQYAEILGVPPNASAKEVKEAYRNLLKVWQKRFSGQPQQQREAEEELRQITEAYREFQALHSQAHTPEVYTDDQTNSDNNSQAAQAPEVIDSPAQQATQPKARPAAAEHQVVKLPKPKQPFVPIPLPQEPPPGRSVFFILSAIAIAVVLLLIFSQLYNEAPPPGSRSRETPFSTLLPFPPSSEDLVDTTTSSLSDLSAPQPTSESTAKFRPPAGSGLATGTRASDTRPTEAPSTAEQSESTRGRQQATKKP
jgi:DnaJ-like protein